MWPLCGWLKFTIINPSTIFLDNQHYVTAVNAGSPAEEAGLRVYDKIISINKQPADHMQNHQVLKSRDQQFEANASRMFSLF